MDVLEQLQRVGGPQLPAARAVARTLGAAGFRTWLVGGSVRDLLLGRPVHDLDLVSAATPEQVEALFPRTLSVGKAFGVIRVLVEGADLEVATFRVERGSLDARHPEELELVETPEEDATRRDFTLNALYLDPLDGELRDPVGGRGDLEARVLRAVGDPRARFEEDALRLLRMARFLAHLQLEPAAGLLEAARAAAPGLGRISRERILEECDKIARGRDLGRAVEVLAGCGLLEQAFPHLALDPTTPPVRAAVAAASAIHDLLLPLLDLEPGAADRLARLEGACAGLPLARTRAAFLVEAWGRLEVLRAEHLQDPDAGDAAVLARLVRGDAGSAALELGRAWAVALGQGPEPWDEIAAWADSRELEPAALLRAGDLLERGVEPGPRLGALLRAAEDEQLRGALRQREDALAWLVERLERES
ncbi:MAG: CCA tRNA nucleotidyltransferase [Planctomycetes bacterium]|nr:CCA tRNA nucleotidyltransferase [Planctomycetota bacterium]MDA0947395.1 CCA tRNA nucleotidyltransferase [Planctomycetota bacterium]